MVRDHQPRDAPPAHFDFDLVVLEDAAVEIREGDGAQLVVLRLERAQPLALHAPVGDGGTAGHPAEEGVGAEAFVVGHRVHRGAFAGDPAPGHGNGAHEARQILEQRVFALQDPGVGFLLSLEGVAADEAALAR
jgi:hypothetical protein